MNRSKFWAGGSSSSESENGSSESEPEILEAANPKLAKRTLWAAESSSSEEERRVVKSARERHWDLLREHIRMMGNHQKISDFAELTKDYECLLKGLQRAKATVEKDGIPKFFVRAITELDAFVEDRYRDKLAVKKLSKAKATALNSLRAKIRKHNEEYRESIEKYRDNPKAFESSESSEDSDSDAESDDSSISPSYSEDESDINSDSESSAKITRQNRSGSERSDWSDSQRMASDDEAADLTQGRHERAVAKWGVKEASSQPRASVKKTKKHTTSSKMRVTIPEEVDDPAAPLTLKDINILLDSRDLSLDVIRDRIRLLAERRGRRGVDRQQQSKVMRKLAELARDLPGNQPYLEVIGHLLVSEFDSCSGSGSCLPTAAWINIAQHINGVVDILESDGSLSLIIYVPSVEDVTEKPVNKDIVAENCHGITILAERLDDEFSKAMQLTDHHTEDYKERLTCSIELIALLYRVYVFLKKRDRKTDMATIALRLTEQMHYRHDTIASSLWDVVRQRLPDSVKAEMMNDIIPSELIENFTNIVFEHGDKRSQTRALLHLAFSKAMHDSYFDVQDFLLTASVQDTVSSSDVSTQILYNRALVQLGLCAFRKGYITQAHGYLSDVCSLYKHKELLAQGVSSVKLQDKTAEQDRAEKRRLLPYHMHINLEMLECAYHISAMMLEVPTMAAASAMISNLDAAQKFRRPISRHFRKLLENHDKQTFSGPPENSKEVIMCATKYLQKGNWLNCSELLFSLQMWERIPNADMVKETLLNRIKTEALRTYIFTFGKLYASFAVDQMSEMFHLSKNHVHSTLSRMLVREELLASWDESSSCVMIDEMSATRIQKVSVILSNAIALAVDQNEHTLNMKNPKFASQQTRAIYLRDDQRPNNENTNKSAYHHNHNAYSNRASNRSLVSKLTIKTSRNQTHQISNRYGGKQPHHHVPRNDRSYFDSISRPHRDRNYEADWNPNRSSPSWEIRAEGAKGQPSQRWGGTDQALAY